MEDGQDTGHKRNCRIRFVMYTSKCKVCSKNKFYKNGNSFRLCKDKPCRSCANSLSQGGKGSCIPIDGKKKCAECKTTKKTSEFYTRPDGSVHTYCKVCAHKKSLKYNQTYYRYAIYGISKEEFDRLVLLQNSKCSICGKKSKLNIDHNHSTGKFRGLLCRECNLALGLVEENIDTLKEMIEYLRGR